MNDRNHPEGRRNVIVRKKFASVSFQALAVIASGGFIVNVDRRLKISAAPLPIFIYDADLITAPLGTEKAAMV